MEEKCRGRAVSKSGNNKIWDEEIPSPARDSMRRWFLLWGLVGFEQSAVICFSSRMSRAFGRCFVQQRRISISTRLKQMPLSILEEVLCHESAHLAAFELFGDRCQPHGHEWAQLVRSAGFEPHRRVMLDQGAISALNSKASYVYVHLCPVCQMQRLARRVVRTWRCASCRALGLDGLLEIHRHIRQ
jgi:predicted SprT family Zn-dependent metalloprotease